MIVALMAVALADPVVLRGPVDGALLAAIGPEVAVGARLSEGVAIAAHARVGGSAVGLAVGSRRSLGEGWGADLAVAGGLVVPTIDPGVAVGLTPAIHAGWRGADVRVVVGAVAPTVVRIGPRPAARIPLLVEPWMSVRIGGVWLSGRAALGVVVVPGLAPAVSGTAGLVVATAGRDS